MLESSQACVFLGGAAVNIGAASGIVFDDGSSDLTRRGVSVGDNIETATGAIYCSSVC